MSEIQPATNAMLAMNQLVESETDNAVSLVAGLSPMQETAFVILTRGGTISAAARAALAVTAAAFSTMLARSINRAGVLRPRGQRSRVGRSSALMLTFAAIRMVLFSSYRRRHASGH